MSAPQSNLEALLRDACRRAMESGQIFDNTLRLYRSVIALAREVRLRFGSTMPQENAQSLAALLAEVSEHASALGLDPGLWLDEALQLQRLAARLSCAARQAEAAPPAERRFFSQNPLHREEPPEPVSGTQHPMQREKPLQPEATRKNSQQNPMHRESQPDDDRLTPWRNDHKTDRDQRAHELLRTVVEERAYTKIEAMNQRDREEREAAERAEAA